MSIQASETAWNSMPKTTGDAVTSKATLVNFLKENGVPPFANYINGFINYFSGNPSSFRITKEDFINALNKFPSGVPIKNKLRAISEIGKHDAFVPITLSPNDIKECQYLLRKTTENYPCILEIVFMQNGNLTNMQWKLSFNGSNFVTEGGNISGSLDNIVAKCINIVKSCSSAIIYTMPKK